MIEKDLIFDKRILKRNLEKGLITEEDYRKQLDELPDLSANFTEEQVGVRDGDFDLGAKERSVEELFEEELHD